MSPRSECAYYGCDEPARATVRWNGYHEKPYCRDHAESALAEFPFATEAV